MERNRSDVKTKRVAAGAAVVRDDVTNSLSRSFFEEWARIGYAAISLERVARRMGVGKAALYRRWPDKKTMASELLARFGLEITDASDQGSLYADVVAVLLAIRRVLRHSRIRHIVADLHAEIERTPELAAAIRPFQTERRQRLDALLDRAIERGEMGATIDREAAIDLLAAPLYWRMAVLNGRPTRGEIERLARMIVAGIRASQSDAA